MQPSEVSIIVVNWNGKPFLKDCLGALFGQTLAPKEIILVDNGSTDMSVNYAREHFPAATIIALKENRGFSGGNAAGLKAATGEFVALVNNDARADERWLECLVRPMLENPTIGICASKLIFAGHDKINSAGDGLTTAGVGFNRGLWQDARRFGNVDSVFGACGAAALYRRRMLEEIGFLDEDFFLYDEDTDLNFRAQLAGWKCVYVPSAVAYHWANATAVRLSDIQVYYHTRNLEFVWIKNMPAGLMLRFAHHKLIQELGAFSYLCIRHFKWRPYLRAKRDAVKMFPLMWKKRKQVCEKRRVPSRYLKAMLTPVFSRELMRQKARQLIQG